MLYVIASGAEGFSLSNGFGSNGYGAHSPGGYSLAAVIVAEVVLTFFFVLIIHGATDPRAPKALAPLAIGLTLTLIHLVCIPIDNTSVNPARSLGPALFVRGWALSQLWVFIVFPIVGGVIAGLVYRAFFETGELPKEVPTAERPGSPRSDVAGRVRLLRARAAFEIWGRDAARPRAARDGRRVTDALAPASMASWMPSSPSPASSSTR